MAQPGIDTKRSKRKITWLASYPKSGNTWVRFMLLNLLYGQQNSTQHLDMLIPDIHKCGGELRLPTHRVKLVKTHFLLNTEMPLAAWSAACIYIVRNPLDVMMSNLNYAFLQLAIGKQDATRNRIKQQYIEQFIRYRGDPRWIQLGRGSWSEHVQSWTRPLQMPCLVVRYEDLLSRPRKQLERVARFLDLEISMTELVAAVENSTFEQMKTIENRELASNRKGFFLDEIPRESASRGNRFMNRGTSGRGRAALSREQLTRFYEQFAPVMSQFGYLPEDLAS